MRSGSCLLDPSRASFDIVFGDMDSNTALEDWESLRMNPKLCQSITVLNEMGVLPPRNSTWFAHECKVNGRKHAISTISNLFKDNWPNAYKDGKFK